MGRAEKGVKHADGRAVTMEDVAREAAVSRALVSLVMRESPNVSDERRRRVLAAAERLGYRPNAMARGLASRRTHTIGVLLNDLTNPFFGEMTEGIVAAADATGYRLLIGTGGRTAAGERRSVDAFFEHRVDGLLLVGPRLPQSELEAIARSTPTIVAARPLGSRAVDTVMNDDVVGARLAVRHLLDLGHRRIAHIDGGRGAGAAPRRTTYVRELERAGLKPLVVPGEFTDAAGMRGAERLLHRAVLPTAVFAANDLVAAGALDRFEDAGLRVPEDISIVGYDNTFLAALHHMSLTTVDQPRPEIGRRALTALVERIEGRRTTPVHHRVEPTLVVRATTGPPSS